MVILLFLHVVTATLGLIAGFLAIVLRKGSGLHVAAGLIFVPCMLAMSGTAVVLAALFTHVWISIVAGLLTFYLVVTAWWILRRGDSGSRMYDLVAAAFASAVALTAFIFAAYFGDDTGADEVPPGAFVIFGGIALLFAASDLVMFYRPATLNRRRIARHLWRMSLALLLATLSFYPGQAQLFPEAARGSNLLFLPHLLIVGSMLYWSVRVRLRRRSAAQ